MSLYRLLSLRYLGHRWDRAALVVISIALGVATLVSSRILNRCIETAAAETATPLGLGDLFVSNGELGVTRTVADDIRAAKLPGVRGVQPIVVERVYLPGQNNRAAVLVGADLGGELLQPGGPLGVTMTPTGEGPLVGLLAVTGLVKDGKWAEAADAWNRLPGRPVFVSRAIQDGRADKSKPLILRYGAREVAVTPVAVVAFPKDSPAAMLGDNVVGMEVTQAARFARPAGSTPAAAVVGGLASEGVGEALTPPKLNRIDVTLEPGADVEAVRAAVADVVGDRASVRTPAMQGRSTQEIVEGVQIAFSLCSAAAMVVGLFLVYNALAVTVAERRPDIGVLRSLGATRPQVVTLFAVLALVLGLIGAAVGVPLGTVMARTVLAVFSEELGAWFLNPATNPPWPTLGTVALAALAGVGTAVFAALLPAIQAANQDPADVVRRSPRPAGSWRHLHQAACLILILGGVGMVLLRHHLPARVGAFGGMMTALVGLLLSAPILVSLLVRLVHPLLRRVLPIEARLAADNLTRSPGRTGVVIGALGAGVAVMIQTAGVGRSNEQPVVRWLNEGIQAERFVFAGNLAEASSSQTPLDASILPEIARLPGVEAVSGFRYIRPEYNGTVVFVGAIDFATYAEQTAKRAGTGGEKFALLRSIAGSKAVVVSDNFAVKHAVKVGDDLTLPGPRGPVRLPIRGTVPDYAWSRGSVFIDRPVYAELLDDPHVDMCHVFLTDPAAGAAVATFAADRGLTVQDLPAFRTFLSELIDRVYLLAYLQQIIVGLVAALGVVTALLISVLQRRRELGLLLAVGATPGQVVRSVLAEALLMGGFGTALGVLIGLPMEWYVLSVVLPEESGFVFDLVVPWRAGAAVAAGAVGVAAVAGLLPALHAVRTRIPEAIAYE